LPKPHKKLLLSIQRFDKEPAKPTRFAHRALGLLTRKKQNKLELYESFYREETNLK